MSADSKEAWGAGGSRFESTHWSMVLEAGHQSSPDSRKALENLCRQYWYPLYAYVRHRGCSVHEAEDLVQAFFTRLLDQDLIAVADPTRGRFRSFLLTALRNFMANERKKAQAEKRGGGVRAFPIDTPLAKSKYSREPAHRLTPERLYERQWAVTVLDQVMAQLRDEFVHAGKENLFDCLNTFLSGSRSEDDYDKAAVRLRISKASAMTAVSRLRRRYRELLRSEIARIVATQEEVEDEIGQLFAALGD